MAKTAPFAVRNAVREPPGWATIVERQFFIFESGVGMTARIDAHHHLWRYRSDEFPWIDEDMTALRRDFLPEDLLASMRAAGVEGAVVVQARQALAETDWLLDLADRHAWMRGVVGWAPLASDEFPAVLDRLVMHGKLKGLRHVIQDEPDEQYILSDAFNRGVSRLRGTALVYDILIYERHLPQTITFVDRHPGQVFVLDHVAKPLIRLGEREPWATHLRELARRENVFCKISGMVTEADPARWTPAGLQPYWEIALEAFGPQRLLAGSDWPVCELACSYTRWFELVRQWTEPLSVAEREGILGGNAIRAYRLDAPETLNATSQSTSGEDTA
jgi:L-fuconolactonase